MIRRTLPISAFVLSTIFCAAGSGVYAGSQGANATDDASVELTIDTNEINRIVALSDDFAYGEYLAGECASCHLTTEVPGSKVPVIHGAVPEYLVQALLEYRAGIRDNTTMALVANGLDDEEISAIVHYLTTSAL